MRADRLLSILMLLQARGSMTAQALADEVEVSVRVDPSLLGGVIAKVGDLVFDGSLRTQLRQLRANLMR